MVDVKGRLNRGVVGIVVAALVVVGAAVWWFGFREAPLESEQALEVGGEVVSVEEFDTRGDVLTLIHALQRPAEAEAAEVFRRQMAKSIAVSMVLEDAAEQRDLTVERAEAAEVLSGLTEQLGGQERFNEFLVNAGVTEVQVINELLEQLRARKLYEAVTADVDPVDETELRKAFEANKGHLAPPETRTIDTIVVETEAEAQKVRQRLEDGASFAALAKRVSIDESTADEGGRLGTLERSVLEDDYAALAFAAEEGAIFGPVETWSGWHVGRVVEVIESSTPTFEEAAAGLRAKVEDQRRGAAWEEWLAAEFAQAEVRYGDDFRPTSPDTPGGAVPGL